jgi:hypothetical protein
LRTHFIAAMVLLPEKEKESPRTMDRTHGCLTLPLPNTIFRPRAWHRSWHDSSHVMCCGRFQSATWQSFGILGRNRNFAPSFTSSSGETKGCKRRHLNLPRKWTPYFSGRTLGRAACLTSPLAPTSGEAHREYGQHVTTILRPSMLKSLYLKILIGRYADTIQFGASTISLIFKSTAAPHKQYACSRVMLCSDDR